MDPKTRLTHNFTFGELTESDTALRLGIDNTPPPEIIPRLRVLAGGLEQIRGILGFPVNVTSGYRCEALERVLCWKDFMRWCRQHGQDPATAWGAYFSTKGHPQGYAADWTCRRFGSPRTCIEAIVRADRVRLDQLIEEGTWAHASFDPRMRGQILVATFTNGEPSYSMLGTA